MTAAARFLSLLLGILLAGCTVDPKSQPEGRPWVSIGVVDDSPDLYALLDREGIEHTEDGSVVYSLLVPEEHSTPALELLLKHRVGKGPTWFRTPQEVRRVR